MVPARLRCLAVVLANEPSEQFAALNLPVVLWNEALVEYGVVSANTPIWMLLVVVPEPDCVDVVQLTKAQENEMPWALAFERADEALAEGVCHGSARRDLDGPHPGTSPRNPSSIMRIFSSALNLRRVARRIPFTTFLAMNRFSFPLRTAIIPNAYTLRQYADGYLSQANPTVPLSLTGNSGACANHDAGSLRSCICRVRYERKNDQDKT